ncbi:VOC family protein [Rhizobium tropici]|uniref:VOC family protein n=1 Tax=Rhizobium tropici TaxID=398 RepID=A0A5B0VPV2_RHITR|nr:VOC family protein [Rhizobium tropici]KAA1176647.1 VOC family protein [Rhizobium tropici]
MDRARLVGINHVALEVGNVEDALAFYHCIFKFELRGTHKDDEGRIAMAFIDMGDQFLALIRGRGQSPDESRHFGLVVDDRTSVRTLAEAAGATLVEGRFLDFLDPWGNRIEVVEYADLQFSKTDAVMRAMGLQIEKRAQARQELREKGMADE